jgi:hypothetical protein
LIFILATVLTFRTDSNCLNFSWNVPICLILVWQQCLPLEQTQTVWTSPGMFPSVWSSRRSDCSPPSWPSDPQPGTQHAFVVFEKHSV